MVIADDVSNRAGPTRRDRRSRSGCHTSVTDVASTAQGRSEAQPLAVRLAAIDFASCSPARASGGVLDVRARWSRDCWPKSAMTSPSGTMARTRVVRRRSIRRDVPNWTILLTCPTGQEVTAVAARADRVSSSAPARPAGEPGALLTRALPEVLGARWVGLPASVGLSLCSHGHAELPRPRARTARPACVVCDESCAWTQGGRRRVRRRGDRCRAEMGEGQREPNAPLTARAAATAAPARVSVVDAPWTLTSRWPGRWWFVPGRASRWSVGWDVDQVLHRLDRERRIRRRAPYGRRAP